MGNNQIRFFTVPEAIEVLGQVKWNSVKSKLESHGKKAVDFLTFYNIILIRFDRIPRILVESLFKAFSSDIDSPVDIEVFICNLASAVSPEASNRSVISKFLFRVYESDNGLLERKRVEDMLQLAYAEKLRGYLELVRLQLDAVFSLGRVAVTLKEFELSQIRLDLLVGWIQRVLEVFIETPFPKLSSLERKYSEEAEMEEIQRRFRLPPVTLEQLRIRFHQLCATSIKPKMKLSAWLKECCGLKSNESTLVENCKSEGENSSTTSAVKPPFLLKTLAEVVFLSKADTFKHGWRFLDFVEFCHVFSVASAEVQASTICFAFLNYGCNVGIVNTTEPTMRRQEEEDKTVTRKCQIDTCFSLLRWMVVVLSHQAVNNANTDNIPMEFAENINLIHPTVLAAVNSIEKSARKEENWQSDIMRSFVQLLLSHYALLPGLRDLNLTATGLFGMRPSNPMQEKEFVTELLLRHLQLSSSSSFGVEQRSVGALGPTGEQGESDNDGKSAYGPVGTEWCVISKQWYDSWRLFVGHKHRSYSALSTAEAWSIRADEGREGGGEASGRWSGGQLAPPIPYAINNHLILKNSYSGLDPQLLPGLSLGRQIEVVPPLVFSALQCWYGGGPRISRFVISSVELDTGSGSERTSSSCFPQVLGTPQNIQGSNAVKGEVRGVVKTPEIGTSASGFENQEIDKIKVLKTKRTEIELYPLCLCFHLCDAQGKLRPGSQQNRIFSKCDTVQKLMEQLCEGKSSVDISRVRLWNYAKESWKDQYILSPELTLQAAGILDGQALLLEVAQVDGSWPRSQLHANLDVEERVGTDGTMMTSTSSTSLEQQGELNQQDYQPGSNEKALEESQSQVAQKPTLTAAALRAKKRLRRNTGLVGMDNLGNTCYLNSSLQALLHIDHLAEYFLDQSYIKHINLRNIHGFKGRLARSFGRLVNEVWTSQKQYISPRYLLHEIAHLREQFSGNEQHDAHELLAFLLDGLSEDLNLVHEKPYIEQPDSNDRPDGELAEIWWNNHLSRDHSLIQALFTGQFKSVMRCKSCPYSSARFEPFNFLTVPIPEETQRVMQVVVIPRDLRHSALYSVRVEKTGTVEDVVKAIAVLGISLVDSVEKEKEGKKVLEKIPRRLPFSEDEDPVFLVGDMVEQRVKSFVPLSRLLNSVKDRDQLAFFQVVKMEQEVDEDSEEHSNGEFKQTVEKKDEEKSQPGDNLRLLKQPTNRMVRIAITQRRATLVSDKNRGFFHVNTQGFSFFRMDPFGFTLLEVVPAEMTGQQIYQLVESKFKPFLRAAVQELIRHRGRQLRKRDWSAVGLETLLGKSALIEEHQRDGAGRVGPDLAFMKGIPEDKKNNSDLLREREALGPVDITLKSEEDKGKKVSFETKNLSPNNSDRETRAGEDGLDKALADICTRIETAETDDVVGGPIPSRGFTVRTISTITIPTTPGAKANRGTGNVSLPPVSCSCSRCSWIDRCQGCVIPDSDSVSMTLQDGESLAVDWHYTVFEESLDVEALTRLPRHPSVWSEHMATRDQQIPLSECLKKFTEKERLEDVVCPGCKESDTMRRYFTIWRPPPVLIIQLKRFQFDRTTRRKLTQRVNFPLVDLNLKDYLATARRPKEPSEGVEGGEYSLHAPQYCYDLCSVVHHVGAMGGGHYVATTKVPLSSNGKNEELRGRRDKWVCFNDNLVSDIGDVNDVRSASAYVLFYIRKDVQQQSYEEFIKTVFTAEEQAIQEKDSSNSGETENENDPDNGAERGSDRAMSEGSSSSSSGDNDATNCMVS